VDPITYRSGALGAMVDEYQRAARDLADLVGPLRQIAYTQMRDAATADENCRTIRSVVEHVVRAGYRYVGYLRTALQVSFEAPDFTVETPLDATLELNTLANWTAETFDGLWDMDYQAMEAVRIAARWGPVYDLEQMMEHAIVHLLRHRRQIERFLTESRFRGDRR